MSASKRRAFTLVELLVVISIIGVLIAMLLPAVQMAREAGRKAQCLNNQKQLAFAAIHYDTAKGRFPGWREHVGFDPNFSSEPVSASWMFVLLPYVERGDISRAYGPPNFDLPTSDVNLFDGASTGTRGVYPRQFLELMTCPSDPPATETGAPTSYVVNAGMPDIDVTASNSKFQTGDLAANGIFHDLDKEYNKPPLPDQKKLTMVSSNFISSKDGASNTFLLGERVEARSWADFGDDDFNGEDYTGFMWIDDLPASDPAAPGQLEPIALINGAKPAPDVKISAGATDDPQAEPIYARPSSFHPGLVVMAFADGHVTTINDGIDYKIYFQLMTPDGANAQYADKQPLNSGLEDAKFVPLDDSAF